MSNHAWMPRALLALGVVASVCIVLFSRREQLSRGQEEPSHAEGAVRSREWEPDVPIAGSATLRFDRIFVLASDAGHLDEMTIFDAELSIDDVKGYFRPRAKPEIRALIVSREFVHRIDPPRTSDSFGSIEYEVASGVISRGHLLFAEDTSSRTTLTALGLEGTVPEFDPLGRPVQGDDFSEGVTSAGHGLVFDFAGPLTGSGWTQVEVVASASQGSVSARHEDLNEERRRVAVATESPPYAGVYDVITEYFTDFEQRSREKKRRED